MQSDQRVLTLTLFHKAFKERLDVAQAVMVRLTRWSSEVFSALIDSVDIDSSQHPGLV